MCLRAVRFHGVTTQTQWESIPVFASGTRVSPSCGAAIRKKCRAYAIEYQGDRATNPWPHHAAATIAPAAATACPRNRSVGISPAKVPRVATSKAHEGGSTKMLTIESMKLPRSHLLAALAALGMLGWVAAADA